MIILQDRIDMKRIIAWIFCLTLISAGCAQQKNTTQSPDGRTVTIKNQQLSVEVVDTAEKMELGLSYRDSMPQQSGMLFDFRNQTSKRPGFWMKGMRFPIDIIWIKDGQIIAIDHEVPAPRATTAEGDLPLYYPPTNIDYVLEVNGGWSDEKQIAVGNEVRL